MSVKKSTAALTAVCVVAVVAALCFVILLAVRNGGTGPGAATTGAPDGTSSPDSVGFVPLVTTAPSSQTSSDETGESSSDATAAPGDDQTGSTETGSGSSDQSSAADSTSAEISQTNTEEEATSGLPGSDTQTPPDTDPPTEEATTALPYTQTGDATSSAMTTAPAPITTLPEPTTAPITTAAPPVTTTPETAYVPITTASPPDTTSSGPWRPDPATTIPVPSLRNGEELPDVLIAPNGDEVSGKWVHRGDRTVFVVDLPFELGMFESGKWWAFHEYYHVLEYGTYTRVGSTYVGFTADDPLPIYDPGGTYTDIIVTGTVAPGTWW